MNDRNSRRFGLTRIRPCALLVSLCLMPLAGCDGGRPPVRPSLSASASLDPSVAIESGASAVAIDSFSVRLTWRPVPSTRATEIWRDGQLRDRIGASAGTYTDYLLWERTTYTYQIRFIGRSGDVSAAEVVTTTPSQTGVFPRPYSSTSFWNTPIPHDAQVDANSARMVRHAIARFASSANLVNTGSHGYPVAYASPDSRMYEIDCTKYDCHQAVSFRIPTYARPSTAEDHHLVVIDPAAGKELDLFGARCCWTASSRYVTEADGWGALCAKGQHCNGAVASGFAEAGGLIRPEEIRQGHIDHALGLATPYTRLGYIACPATHTDGRYSALAIPEGARVQLDPSFNVAAQSWPRWKKVVARALQMYGAYVVDTAGSLAIRAEGNQARGYDAWASVGVRDNTLSNLPWSRMRVLQLIPC